MGTDQAGRDVLTRGVYGGRISLRIGFWVAVVSLSLGVTVGLISGYYAATFIDDIINAIIMTLGSIPLLFLLIILSRIFKPGPEGAGLSHRHLQLDGAVAAGSRADLLHSRA